MKQLLHEDDVVLYFEGREGAHSAILRANAVAKALVANNPEQRCRIIVGEDRETLSIKQRGFLHAAVFPQIAEQAIVNGTRYTADVWKEFYRARFLGDRWVMRAVPRWDPKLCALVQPKRATPHRVRVSTEDLSDKQYSEHIDKVIDTATLELGVVFEFAPAEREAVRYVRPARKKAEQREAVTA